VGIPLIERIKIQAEVLVPLVKALRAKLGEERTNALVRKTLGNHFRRHKRTFALRQVMSALPH